MAFDERCGFLDQRQRCRRAVTTGAIALAFAALGACQTGGGGATDAAAPASGPRPLSLKSTGQGPAANSALRPLNRVAVDKGIARYVINKRKKSGSYESAGADLDGDGVPEALVYFTDEQWCGVTGCALVVFRKDARGYRAISRTIRVRPPVLVEAGATNGWRNLIVATGGAGVPLKSVILKFDNAKYTKNASKAEELPPFVAPTGETAISSAAVAASASRAQPPSAGLQRKP